jgi:CRP-like cAMP-binding protein
VLLVSQGWAVATDPYPDGTRTFLELRGRGQLLGETSALSGGLPNADVTAVCRTVVRAIRNERFLSRLRRGDLLLKLLLDAQESHRMSNVRAGLRRSGVVNGLSRLLLDLTRTTGSSFVADVPQKVLADVLGVTPRTLRAAIAELRRRGALAARRPAVDIKDAAILRELARDGEGNEQHASGSTRPMCDGRHSSERKFFRSSRLIPADR